MHQTVIKTLQQLNVRWATWGAVEKTAAQAWKCAGGKALPGGFTVERVEPESIRVSGAYREAGQRWVYEAVPSGGCGRAFRQVRQPAPVRTSLSGRVELIIESL